MNKLPIVALAVSVVPGAALVLALGACGHWQGLREALEPDVLPPVLLDVRVTGPRSLALEFDEGLRHPPEALRIEPPLPVDGTGGSGPLVEVSTGEQEPGARYLLEATVCDEAGNSLTVLVEFYGHNPRVPLVLINEFTTRGTGNHPDLVELKVLESGNMGGVVLYQGTPGSYDDRLVFPAFEIETGRFILVHFKPQGIPEEIDETEDPGLSGGLDAAAEAFDFWVPGGTGLSGNNGVISVYRCPGGAILDGVLYSNRTSDSDTRYGGFGTRNAWERAQELVRDGGWRIEGNGVRPEDAVNPEGSTGTRSICRDARSTDTDSRHDWHIVPTSGFTFGRENSDERYLRD